MCVFSFLGPERSKDVARRRERTSTGKGGKGHERRRGTAAKAGASGAKSTLEGVSLSGAGMR